MVPRLVRRAGSSEGGSCQWMLNEETPVQVFKDHLLQGVKEVVGATGKP